MFKLKLFKKFVAVTANVSLLLNSFLPFLLVAQPAYAQSPETIVSTIEYNQSIHKINVNANTSDKISYQLFYKTDEKIDAIVGNDLSNASFYIGTCSNFDCLPQNVSRGILKIESESQFYSQFFTIENNTLTVVKKSNSNQSDLNNEENNFLENNQILGETTSNWTFKNIELNKEYVAPQNDQVKLTFTKLPENSGNIKIEEITLTPEQIEQTGSLSNKAYDITSDMVDGTFAYNLSLPVPESAKGQDIDIKFAEEISEINSAQTINNTTENEDIVSAQNINHFTVFFAVIKTTNKNLVEKEVFKKGETVYINTFVSDGTFTKIRIKDQNNNIKKEYDKTISSISQYKYIIRSSDLIGKYSIDIGSYQIVGGKWYNPEWGWVWKNNVDTFTIESVCGDVIKDIDEECDNGNTNGQVCSPEYNSSCNYCSSTCEIVTENNFDDIKPETEILEPLNNQIVTSNSNVSVKYTDNMALKQIVAHLYDSNNNAVLSVWSSPIINEVDVTEKNIVLPLTNVPEGDYYLKANATDKANHISTTQIHNFTIDNTKPIIKVNLNRQSHVNSGATVSSLKVPEIEAFDKNLSKIAIFRKSDGSQLTSWTNVYKNKTTFKGIKWLGSGTYIIRAYDDAELISDDFEITIDNNAPAKPELVSPNNNSVVNGASVTNEWKVINDAVSYVYESYYSDKNLDNVSNLRWHQVVSTPNHSKTATNVANANFYWRVKAIDQAGNESEWSDLWKVTIDNNAPIVSINTPSISNTNVEIKGTVIDANPHHYYLVIKNNKGQIVAGPGTVNDNTSFTDKSLFNWNISSILDGVYTIGLEARDAAGNKDAKSFAFKEIIIDKTIPMVTALVNPNTPDASNGWYKTQPEITLTGVDTNLDKIEYQWDSQTDGSWTTYTTVVKLLTEGNHDLYYRAIDKAGNVSLVGVQNIKWDQTDLEYGPQNISANPNPTSGSTSQIKWDSAKDNSGIDKYEIQWKLNGGNSTYFSKTVGAGVTGVEIDQLTEGKWSVKVIAFDTSGRTKDNSIDVVVDRTSPSAPVLTLTETGTGTATLSWNAVSDAKDYIIWYGSVQGTHQYGARVGNVTNYTVRGLGAGNYYFIIKAVDEAQNQSADSNEVNTGTIIGAAGTTPGQPAEGFSPEVLGATTDNTPTPTPTVDGNVLGTSVTNGFNWWWLLILLLIIICSYVISKKIFKRKRQNK